MSTRALTQPPFVSALSYFVSALSYVGGAGAPSTYRGALPAMNPELPPARAWDASATRAHRHPPLMETLPRIPIVWTFDVQL